MDPNLFHLDWERTFEVLVTIVVLAFLIERGLSIIFENRLFIKHCEDKGTKEFISLFVCALVCFLWKFDALSIIILADKTNFLGYVITGAIISGGSKASVKLFRDVLGFMSSAEKERQAKLSAKLAKHAVKASNENH